MQPPTQYGLRRDLKPSCFQMPLACSILCDTPIINSAALGEELQNILKMQQTLKED